MSDEAKTKEQLLAEVKKLRREIDRYRASETEHKRAEEALRTTNRQLQDLLNYSPHAILLKDIEGKFLFINHYSEKDLNITNVDLTGKTVHDIFPKEEADRIVQEDQQVIEAQAPLTFEDSMTKNHEIRSYILAKFPLFNEDGVLYAVGSIATDITEHKRTEIALVEERNLLRTLIDNMPDHIYVKDTKSRYLIANKAAAQNLGVTAPDKLVGKTDFDFPYLPKLAERNYTDEQAVIKSGQPLINQEESNVDRETDTMLWFLTTKIPFRDSQGKIVGLIGMARDITDRRRVEEELRKHRDHLEDLVKERTTELTAVNEKLQQEIAERGRVGEALRESEEKYRTLFESFQDVFYRADTEGNIILASPSIVQLLGYAHDEAKSLNLEKNIFARPKQWKEFTMLIEKKGYLEEFEVLLKRCDGSVIWGSMTSQWYTDKEGRILGIEGMIRDISERKKDDKLLKLNKQRLEALVQLHQMHESSAEEIAEHVLEKAVELTESIFGFMNYVLEEDGSTVPSLWSKSVIKTSTTGKPEHFSMKNIDIWTEVLHKKAPLIINDYSLSHSAKKDYLEGYGELKCLLIVPVIDEDKIVLLAAVANKEGVYDETDMNELTLLMDGMWNHIKARLAAEELHKAKEDAEAINVQLREFNASKDTFFSIIAHDLRGPLSSLHDLTQVIEENLDNYSPGELREMIVLQKTAAENLYNLLENLLTWSRVQRGIMTYQPRQIGIKWLVARNIELLKMQAEKKQIALRSPIQKEISVYADFNMVDAVVRNLISNAIKFTHVGGAVEISAQQDNRAIEVSVSDTGIGIGEEHIPKLFRIDAKYKRLGTAYEEGTGLGLILCKEFVEKHDGKIWVESQLGEGTTFKFTLPKDVKQKRTIKKYNE
jgi:PAS domain S-box-containing protein